MRRCLGRSARRGTPAHPAGTWRWFARLRRAAAEERGRLTVAVALSRLRTVVAAQAAARGGRAAGPPGQGGARRRLLEFYLCAGCRACDATEGGARRGLIGVRPQRMESGQSGTLFLCERLQAAVSIRSLKASPQAPAPTPPPRAAAPAAPRPRAPAQTPRRAPAAAARACPPRPAAPTS